MKHLLKTKTFIGIIIITAAQLTNTGCTTATYGKTFKATSNPKQHFLKIYTGGFAFKDSATRRLDKEAKIYMQQNGFKSYKIISSNYLLAPLSGTEFIVEFEK